MDFPQLHAFNKFVPAQAALSASTCAVAHVFSLTSAAAITTVALQALGFVAVTALVLDLAAYFFEVDWQNSIPLNHNGGFESTMWDDEYQHFLCLTTLQAISTVGLFAIGVVAAPVAQYGLISAGTSALFAQSLDLVQNTASRLKRMFFPPKYNRGFSGHDNHSGSQGPGVSNRHQTTTTIGSGGCHGVGDERPLFASSRFDE